MSGRSAASGARKVVKSRVRMSVAAGQAAPSPPVGPRLGQLGVNIMQFCKDFNAATAGLKDGIPVTTLITAYGDRTCDFRILSPPTSFLLKQVAGVTNGSAEPGKAIAGQVPIEAVYEIAKLKQKDAHLQSVPLQGLCKSILGTARSCGIEVVFNPLDAAPGPPSSPAAL